MRQALGEARALVATVTEDALDEREEASRARVEHQRRAVAILDVGRVDDDVEHQAERVDKNVPLAARDLLARIVARRVERRAPF